MTPEHFFSYVFFDSYDPGRQYNNTSLSHSATENNATNTASANLITGKLGVLNAGNTTGFAFSDVIAQFGDTITASGPTGGLNLGVNFAVNGTSSYTDPSHGFTFLWVFAYKPGTFDQTFYNSPSNILYDAGYLLGTGTDTATASGLFGANNVPLTGTYGDGPNNIGLTIPFATLGSNFQINVVLGSVFLDTSGTNVNLWSADFSHTVGASLSAPDGVTLFSASGDLPGTTGAPSAVPEPASVLLLGSGASRSRTGLSEATLTYLLRGGFCALAHDLKLGIRSRKRIGQSVSAAAVNSAWA